MADVTIYDYWRSSASYRVRIALNLKGIEFKSVPVNLLDGSHQTKEHRQRNPQGFVPALAIDGMMMTQSLAIIEYLDSRTPQPPLLPARRRTDAGPYQAHPNRPKWPSSPVVAESTNV